MRKYLAVLLVATCIFTACETEVDPSLDQTLDLLVIDAWLTNNDPVQQINITRSQPYFEAALPAKVAGATVVVTDLTDGTVYNFAEGAERYTWDGGVNTFGVIGHEYELRVEIDENVYTSITRLNPVPPIDSITFRLEEGSSFFDDLIFGEFFATDLQGRDDTYWIKTWKNGQYLGKSDEINIAYDAAFSASPENDGVQFIQPIRDGISPFDEARNEELLSPYNLPDTLAIASSGNITYRDGSFFGVTRNDTVYFEGPDALVNNRVPVDLDFLPLNGDRFEDLGNDRLLLKGDSVYVEIHSISNEAYFFMNQLSIELDREPGFGALFATPLGNVPTNVEPSDTDERVAGFFNIAAISSAGERLTDVDQVRVVE